MGENMCDTGLGLAIGSGSFLADKGCRREPKPPVMLHLWFPPCAMDEADQREVEKTSSMEVEDLENPIRSTTKKKRKLDDIDAENYDPRKKLRLTKEQSTLLEDNFRSHSTLNYLQKQELAQKLGLRPRQVEVWFQNRRARTKLKQTEVDCEVLKRWCESLSDENRRLRRELQEQRFCAEVSKVDFKRLACPSCTDQKLMAAHEEEKGSAFAVGKKKAGVLQLCS